MKKILIFTLLLTAAGTARAQEDISKQLEVTRAYTPNVGKAAKLPVEPDMTDTVRLRPEISYRITSTASATSFETRPYEAATVAGAEGDAAGSLYVRAGAGAPFVTEADVYFTPRLKEGRAFGLFVNHSGSYSRIVNDLGIEANATEMTNGAGLWGSRQWRRYSLEGDVTYDGRLYNPYGAANVDHDPASSVPAARGFVYDKRMDRFTLGLARAGVSFGDNFGDLSRLNFRAGVDAGYAHGGDGRGGREQANFDARVTLAQMFGAGWHGFELVLSERGAFDLGAANGDAVTGNAVKGDAVTVTFAPRYLLAGGMWSLRAGVDVRWVSNKGHYRQDYLGFTPSAELRGVLAGGAFVPFASYTSRVMDGDREALSRRNPYVVTGGSTAWINDARVGFSGDLGDVFSYRLGGGVSLFRDYQLFVGTQVVTPRAVVDGDGATGVDYDPMWFRALAADGARFTAGAELALHNLGGFGARLYGNWNKFEFSGTYDVGDLPLYDAGLELSWRWKDVVALRLGAELIGERNYLIHSGAWKSDVMSTHDPDFAGERFTVSRIEPVVDLTFGADVKVARDFWVYVEGENLANQVLYPYPHYRGLGASVLGGIKVVF